MTDVNPIEQKLGFSMLLAFYGELLTETQRETARLYWEEDWTISEIAAQTGVSRQNIHDMLTRIEKHLTGMEEKLHLAERFEKIISSLEDCERLLQHVSPADDASRKKLADAAEALRRLRLWEEQ